MHDYITIHKNKIISSSQKGGPEEMKEALTAQHVLL